MNVSSSITLCPVCGKNMDAVLASNFDRYMHVTYWCDCGCQYEKSFCINENGELTESTTQN